MPPITSPPITWFKRHQRHGIYNYYEVHGGPGKTKDGYFIAVRFLSDPPALMSNTTIQPMTASLVPGACTRQPNQSPRPSTAKLLKKRLNTQRWYFINRGTRNPQLAAMAPNKSKVAAGLTCGALWTIAKGIQMGDLVICLNSMGSYWIAEVPGNYSVYARLCVATSPRSKSVVSAMQVKPKLLERKSIGERIKEQILDLVATFEIGLGLGLMLGEKLAHDSKAAVLQQNSEKAVKKFAEI